MDEQSKSNLTTPAIPQACGDDPNASLTDETSRRKFLKASAGLVAAGVAIKVFPESAMAQNSGATDPELSRLQQQRRILLKGGVVLTLDRQIGDFAQADVLIEDGNVLELATIEGARCANLDSKVGTLAPGKEVDIVMLQADRLDVWPLNNAPGAVVNLMHPGHVESVFIAGKVRKWRGNLVGVDEQRIRRLMQESRDAVVRRAGFQLNLLG